MQNITVKLKKVGKELIPYNHYEEHKLKKFTERLSEGNFVDCYYSSHIDSREKSNSQLAKVHVLLKELATETGYTPTEIKEVVKKEASLFIFEGDANIGLKSFRDCSKTELNDAIEICIRIGDEIGCNLH